MNMCGLVWEFACEPIRQIKTKPYKMERDVNGYEFIFKKFTANASHCLGQWLAINTQ